MEYSTGRDRRVWLSGFWMGWGERAAAKLLTLYVTPDPKYCPLGVECICMQGGRPDPAGHWN